VIRVTILSSSHALRAGLHLMLGASDTIEVIGEASSLANLDSTGLECDVIVATFAPLLTELEKAMPGSEAFPAWLLLCDEPQVAREIHSLPVRAWGLLPLDASADEMIAAVNALYEGMLVGAPHLLLPWLADLESKVQINPGLGFSPGSEPFPGQVSTLDLPSAADHLLTPREAEVLALLAQGLANKQIAVVLGISEHTVKFHVSSIYGKLGVGNRTEAVRVGARRGLILL
jgi:DNA-binding NarL/FixJ family response regulator